MANRFHLKVSDKATVLIAFRVRTNEIPLDQEGRPVYQMFRRSGGQTEPEGKLCFGGPHNPRHSAVKVLADEFFRKGLLVNNMQMTEVTGKDGAVRDDVRNVRLWLSANGSPLESWGDAGRFALERLARAYALATVFENEGGAMFSVNLIDAMKPEKPHRWTIVPKVFTPE